MELLHCYAVICLQGWELKKMSVSEGVCIAKDSISPASNTWFGI